MLQDGSDFFQLLEVRVLFQEWGEGEAELFSLFFPKGEKRRYHKTFFDRGLDFLRGKGRGRTWV